MNRKQYIVLWVAVSVIVLMVLYPPWRFRMSVPFVPQIAAQVPTYQRGPYALIFKGPKIWRYKIEDFDVMGQPEIDWVRLILPIFIVSLVASALFITLREKKPSPH
jgi:hypothetical protein